MRFSYIIGALLLILSVVLMIAASAQPLPCEIATCSPTPTPAPTPDPIVIKDYSDLWLWAIGALVSAGVAFLIGMIKSFRGYVEKRLEMDIRDREMDMADEHDGHDHD